jgi:pimeloyl-ACP methyl ester carboxylesterase
VDEVFPALRTLAGRFDPTVFDAPAGRARIRLVVTDAEEAWDAVVAGELIEVEDADRDKRADAVLKADAVVWRMIARDVRGGMAAFQAGRLAIRRNLHLGVGFLAATGHDEPGRLRFKALKTRLGTVSMLEAGQGSPILLLHGLGATKAEFLPTAAALASEQHRVIAMDFPGFGDSDKPFPAPYDPPFFAEWAESVLDELGIERAHVLGHSMGGRVALALADDPRVVEVVGLAPWVVGSDGIKVHENQKLLLIHGVGDRMTSAEASRRVVETLQERGLTASFVGLRSADHAMLRRAGTWDHLVSGYLAGTLPTRRDLSGAPELDQLGAQAGEKSIVTVI